MHFRLDDGEAFLVPPALEVVKRNIGLLNVRGAELGEVGKKAQKAAFPWLENDGVTKFNFKVADAWPDGTSRQPELTDMDKKPVTANIGKDSVIRIMFRPHYYNASAGFGVQLQPIKVQVKDLVTFGGGSAADIDFEDVSDSGSLKTGTDDKEVSW